MIVVGDNSIEFTNDGCVSYFMDGSSLKSVPHQIPHYYVISHRCGYGDDVLIYCQVHDFCHLFVAEFILQRPSILWTVANQIETLPGIAPLEESLVQTFQRWLHANEEPIIADVDWHGLKAKALKLLDRPQPAGPVEAGRCNRAG